MGHTDAKRDAKRRAEALAGVDLSKSSIGSPQPKPDGASDWSPITKAWWKSLGHSDVAMVYQPIDWVNAWVAGMVLDQMVNLGFSAGLYTAWQHTCEWLHAPRVDLLNQADEAATSEAPVDEDDAAAEEAVGNAMAALRVA